ncbi:MAG: hypothetical protein Q8R39_02685 [bacterium]|nr:hypothetical protein [bacterium]MDZ4284281.1 hypothetical protein [Patescibacteria group bacterium]
MSTWKDDIIGLFTGTSLGIARECVDWTGMGGLLCRWDVASPDERSKIRDALAEIIAEEKSASTDWGVVLDAAYFAYTQSIWDQNVCHAILALKITTAPPEWQDRVEYVKDCYIAGYMGYMRAKVVTT